jgi:hypothetical protein
MRTRVRCSNVLLAAIRGANPAKQHVFQLVIRLNYDQHVIILYGISSNFMTDFIFYKSITRGHLNRVLPLTGQPKAGGYIYHSWKRTAPSTLCAIVVTRCIAALVGHQSGCIQIKSITHATRCHEHNGQHI